MIVLGEQRTIELLVELVEVEPLRALQGDQGRARDLWEFGAFARPRTLTRISHPIISEWSGASQAGLASDR
jgi:hypothetical protein